MINPDFIIRVLVIVLGFPVFAGLVKRLMGTKKLTGENIFWLFIAYEILLSVIL